MAEAEKIPLWLDCDPGHDDVFAILLAAYHPGIRLMGISTVFGNASLEHTTWNATSVLTAIDKHDSVSVYPGAAVPSVRAPMHAPTDIHGQTGLDGTDLLPQPRARPNTAVAAVDAMAAALLAEPAGRPWLVATGALTNVAALLAKHPQVAGHIAGLSLMGGAVGEGFTTAVYGVVDGVARIGNWTQYAEFNVAVDPEAAAAVFGHPVVAAKTTMIPLDLTHLVLARRDVQELLLRGPEGGGPRPGEGGEAANVAAADATAGKKGKTVLRTMLVELLNFFAGAYRDVFGIIEGPPLHDPLAVAAILTGTPWEIPFYDHDVLTPEGEGRRRERYEVTVVTEGTYEEAKHGAQTGRTVVRLLPPGEEGVRIPRGLDIPLFWRVLEECCSRADEANAKANGSS